jgi:hypothetical protein
MPKRGILNFSNPISVLVILCTALLGAYALSRIENMRARERLFLERIRNNAKILYGSSATMFPDSVAAEQNRKSALLRANSLDWNSPHGDNMKKIPVSLLKIPRSRLSDEIVSRMCFASHMKENLHLLQQIEFMRPHPSRRVRILCASFTHSGEYYKNVQKVKDTWGQKCDGYLAMGNHTDLQVPGIKLGFNGGESYNNLWQKTRAIVAYYHMHYLDDFDYLLIGGDDLYVVMENLRGYLTSDEIVAATRDGKKPIFLGRRFRYPDKNSHEYGVRPLLFDFYLFL